MTLGIGPHSSLSMKLTEFIILLLIMAALRSGCGRYIFALWFLYFFLLSFFSPNLSGRRLDVYHTSTHGVALVRI